MPIVSKKLFIPLFLIFFAVVLFILDFFGMIWHNAPFAAFYSVKGLDVSHHQGAIDWPRVAATKKYSFVFIKATEGHDFSDDDFLKNWQGAKENGLLVGAYHFFSIRSSGKEQANAFISAVPQEDSALPPVIDIEIDLSQDPGKIRTELKDLANELEDHYHKKPILYLTYDTYSAYIKNNFPEYNIWIRDVITPPLLGEQKWIMWQFSNRGRVEGINPYVDINVFKGTKEELIKLTEVKKK